MLSVPTSWSTLPSQILSRCSPTLRLGKRAQGAATGGTKGTDTASPNGLSNVQEAEEEVRRGEASLRRLCETMSRLLVAATAEDNQTREESGTSKLLWSQFRDRLQRPQQ